MRSTPSTLLTIAFLFAAAALAAQAGPCDGPEHRQFDFWLGDWKVSAATGNTSANRITREQGGCLLRETYTAGAYTGTSVNFYDKTTSKWYQAWMDNQGGALRLFGGLEDGKMVLSTDPDEGPVQRVTWTPLEDGRVRQVWEVTQDDGSWNAVFDGHYSRE